MNDRGSCRGLGLLIQGIAGISLFGVGSRQMAPFSGWGARGIYDKGSYASNGDRIYYLELD
jgi:hypothetical protein